MRILVASILFIIGLIALTLTIALFFPNSDGVLDLSKLEIAFLILYGSAAQYTYQRCRAVGQGAFNAAQRVTNSAGICALILIAILAVGYATSVDDQATSLSADQSDAIGQLQLVWFAALLIAVYLSAPSLSTAAPPSDSQPTKHDPEGQPLETHTEAIK